MKNNYKDRANLPAISYLSCYEREDGELMKISMQKIGNGSVLAGALNGRSALGRLLEMVAIEPAAPEPVYLDFAGIDAATASYLRESVSAFRAPSGAATRSIIP